MSKHFILIFFACVCFMVGCKNQDERLKVKATKIILSYVEKNMTDFSVDSINLMAIDSLTDLDFAYFQKIIYENKESEILSNRLMYIPPITDDEYNEQEKLQLKLQSIQKRIQLCNNVLLDIQTDTVAVQYLFIATKIFGKNKKGEPQIHEIGFPIDKNFRIVEIEMSDEVTE